MQEYIDRYEGMKRSLQSFFLDPTGRVLYISGENGIGKTYQVERVAGEQGYQKLDHRDGLRSSPDRKLLISVGGGKFGPKFLHELLYEHRTQVLHFEENIFVQKKNRPILENLVLKNGLVEYSDPGRVPDVPERFEFEGGVIVTSYQPPITVPGDLLEAMEVINVRAEPDPENLIALLRHELASVVESYNQKMPDAAISLDEAMAAVDFYERVFLEERENRRIQVFHMVSIFWSFEMLRTLTSSDYTMEIKKGAILRSFDDTPGMVTPAPESAA